MTAALLLALATVGPLDLAGLDAPKASLSFADAPAARETPAPPKAKPTPALWSRVDSRGGTWTHADRAFLDRYVDAVERSYASPAPITYGAACAGGNCAAPAYRPAFRFFRRR